MVPTIEDLIASTGALRQDRWTPNDWHGADLGNVRLVSSEPSNLIYVFDGVGGPLSYTVSLDCAPLSVQAATVNAVLVQEGL